MSEKTFFDLVSECEGAQVPLGLSFQEALAGMSNAGIGIARLTTDETVAISIKDGYIARGEERVAEIPNFDVLKTVEGIRALINSSGVLGNVLSIEMTA